MLKKKNELLSDVHIPRICYLHGYGECSAPTILPICGNLNGAAHHIGESLGGVGGGIYLSAEKGGVWNKEC